MQAHMSEALYFLRYDWGFILPIAEKSEADKFFVYENYL